MRFPHKLTHYNYCIIDQTDTDEDEVDEEEVVEEEDEELDELECASGEQEEKEV